MTRLEAVVSWTRRSLLHSLSLILTAMFLVPAARTQTDASLSGHIADATGAAVPNATIIITNVETGLQRTLQTDADGHFSASSLQVGGYSVVASKEGFRTETRTSIALTVGERAEADLVLQVGDIHQSVEVPAVGGALAVTTEDVSGL